MSHAPAGVAASPTDLPRSYCVELTSKCPFDCVFCTRLETRGVGLHMDFGLFESLMRQVGHPERILLNSLGESMHYPQLPAAVRQARATGAWTELISTLCSAPESMVRAVLEAGLDQLHVSVHTLDAENFSDIYRLRSAEAMKASVGRFLELRRETGASTVLDFSFVAMERNIDDLDGVVAFAEKMDVGLVRVLALTQPAHRRSLFPAELDGNWLSRSFRRRLADTIGRVRERHPEVDIEEPLLGECGAVEGTPKLRPGDVPSGTFLAGCYESPWETTHVRANGDVVACGDDAMTALGNLAHEELRAIWHGEPYRRLRRSHALGENAVCNDCPIKIVYAPGPVAPSVSGDVDSAQLLWGWYDLEPTGSRWSRQQASLVLAAPGPGTVRVCGLLPPAADGGANRLYVSVDGQSLGEITGGGEGMASFDAVFALPPAAGGGRQLVFATESVYEPRRRVAGSRDARRLGFALVRVEFQGAS